VLVSWSLQRLDSLIRAFLPILPLSLNCFPHVLLPVLFQPPSYPLPSSALLCPVPAPVSWSLHQSGLDPPPLLSPPPSCWRDRGSSPPLLVAPSYPLPSSALLCPVPAPVSWSLHQSGLDPPPLLSPPPSCWRDRGSSPPLLVAPSYPLPSSALLCPVPAPVSWSLHQSGLDPPPLLSPPPLVAPSSLLH